MELDTAIEILREWKGSGKNEMAHGSENLTEALDIILKEVDNPSLSAAIPKFYDDLKAKWNPLTKVVSEYGPHGSSKGVKSTFTLFFDTNKCEWTTERLAFRSFFQEELDKFL